MLRRRAIKIFLYILAGFLLVISGLYIYFRIVTKVDEPEIEGLQQISMERVSSGPDEYSCTHGYIRKVREGWWEMHLKGSPFEIGFAHGLLTRELMADQERAFLERLGELIPSKFYQRFMLGFVRYFNRNLEEYIRPEYQEEIFGISQFASPEFGFMGPAYARMLNYHAAHDLGHAVQNMNLVACTAFATWKSKSADSGLIVGRNFDFFINGDFAKDKILCFIEPDSGYSFVMVTWAGFAGVVSGMNEKGLTVTLNAAKSSIPMGAKTPVSLLAREILQYASNIEEAYRIAQSRQTFVAESFFIGSAADHKAVVIEKSPEDIDIYDPDTNFVIVTNHFQSNTFLRDPLNLENMQNETSIYRHERMRELVNDNAPIDPGIAAAFLRDYKGLEEKEIGLGNEKAVNQFIAHHSVIFQPEKRRIWIAGPPWQLGQYWAYDVDTVFGADGNHGGVDNDGGIGNDCRDAKFCVSTGTGISIPADTLQLATIYPNLQKYRSLASRIESGEFPPGAADSLIKFNPEYFHTYRILGDYFKTKGQKNKAEDYYRIALEKEAPSAGDREAVIGH